MMFCWCQHCPAIILCPGHLLTYARYWVCQRVSPKVFEPGTSSAAHEGSGGGGEEANECNRLGENISHFFHSCNRPRPGWYWNCPTNDRYARLPSYFLLQLVFTPLVAKHTFSPEAAIGAPSSTVLRPSHLAVIRSGLTFAITRRGHNGVLCGRLVAPPRVRLRCIPGTLVKPCHLQPGGYTP